MRFQLAGLPRSGTAWLSAVLNYAPDVMCVHEPVDLNVPVPVDGFRSMGVAGSHLLVPEYRDMPSDLRVFISRSPRESNKSLERLGLGLGLGEGMFHRMEDLGYEYADMCDIIIPFGKLFQIGTVFDLWYKVSNADLPTDKIMAMMNMNVQRNSLQYDFDPRFLESVGGSMAGKGGM